MIKYIKGDATCPQASGPKIIAHICNDRGKFGKGFVVALSKRWDEPERSYREWYRSGFALGDVQFVQVRNDIWVANIIGQHGLYGGSKGPPVRYEAVSTGLKTVAEKAREMNASVHMPRIGCGLGGGTWEKIEPIITEHLNDIEVTVYDNK